MKTLNMYMYMHMYMTYLTILVSLPHFGALSDYLDNKQRKKTCVVYHLKDLSLYLNTKCICSQM